MDYTFLNIYFITTWAFITIGFIMVSFKISDIIEQAKPKKNDGSVLSTWRFYYNWDEDKKTQFKIEASSRDEAQKKAHEIHGVCVETMIQEIED